MRERSLSHHDLKTSPPTSGYTTEDPRRAGYAGRVLLSRLPGMMPPVYYFSGRMQGKRCAPCSFGSIFDPDAPGSCGIMVRPFSMRLAVPPLTHVAVTRSVLSRALSWISFMSDDASARDQRRSHPPKRSRREHSRLRKKSTQHVVVTAQRRASPSQQDAPCFTLSCHCPS